MTLITSIAALGTTTGGVMYFQGIVVVNFYYLQVYSFNFYDVY